MSDLGWGEVSSRFQRGRNWWVSTGGSAGPHAVPVWGVVVDDVLFFYGSPTSIRSRNIAADPRVVIHLEDGEDALILHGTARPMGRAAAIPALVQAYQAKYQEKYDHEYLLDTDYAADVLAYQVDPVKVLAWQVAPLSQWTIRRWT